MFFIILLMKQQYLWSALLLLPMAVSRESVLLVLLCLLISGFRKIRLRVMLVGAVSTFAGTQIVKLLAASSRGNLHGIGELTYMILKVPFNFALNIMGIRLWVNTLTPCETLIWYAKLPLRIGGITEVGYCGHTWINQVGTLGSWICEFGPLLVLFAFLLIRHRAKIWEQPVFIRFCLLYGGACFVLAPFLGSSVGRLVSYSWPLFMVAGPILGRSLLPEPSTRQGFAMALVGGASTWLFYAMMVFSSSLGMAVLVSATVLADWLFWKSLLSTQFQTKMTRTRFPYL